MTFLTANICIGSTYAKTQKHLIKVENSVKETLEKSWKILSLWEKTFWKDCFSKQGHCSL